VGSFEQGDEPLGYTEEGKFIDARFDVFTAVKIRVEVFRVVARCGNVVECQRFGGSCCCHLQARHEGQFLD
jgi:hypothetical protein